MKTLIRHGELLLVSVSKMPEGKTKKTKSLIVGHSETGHHHVVESKTKIEWTQYQDRIFFKVSTPTPLIHKKTVDKHKTLIIQPGIYKVIPKQEYDPFRKVMRRVWD
jgi:hypothetical protein